MNAKERVFAAIEHRKPDVLPAGPFVGYYACEFAKKKLYDYVTDGRTIADAQYALWEALGQDIVVTAADTYYITEGFGMELDYYENELPTARKLPLSSLKDVDKLKVPDPYKDGRMHVYLEAAELLKGKLGGAVALRGTGTGPFSIAAYLLGTQDFLVKLADIMCGEAEPAEEAALHTLLGLASEATIAFLKAQIKVGVDLVYMGDSLASSNMISPAMYREFAQPYHKKVYDAVREDCRRTGAHTLLHICGDNTRMLTDFADTGVELIEIDSAMDLAVCKELVGERVALIGNLSPADTMLNGTPEQVRAQSLRCIEQTKGSGFILGTGCFVAFRTPLENLRTMVRTAHEYTF